MSTGLARVTLLTADASPSANNERADRRAAARILEMDLPSDKPRPAAGVVAFPQAAARGGRIVVLKDPARHSYFRGWLAAVAVA
jgi:hypothetical protein